MVGGRSLGCTLCKQRRIKCDEQWPLCGQCKKSKRACGGPLTPFMYESGRITASKRSVLESRAATEPRTYPLQETEFSQSLRDSPTPTTSRKGTSSIANTSRLPPPVSLGSLELLSADFAQTLRVTWDTGQDFNCFGHFMKFIPVRIGRSGALDAAAECLHFAYKGVLSRYATHGEGQLSRYVFALQELRLKCEQGTSSEETVAAALMLSAFEVIKQIKNTPDYIAHAGGAVAVLKAVGPGCFQSDFGHAILYASLGPVMAASLFTETECLLASPEWSSIFEAPWLKGFCHPVTAQMHKIYASLPRLIRIVRRGTPDLETLFSMHRQAVRTRDHLSLMAPDIHRIMADPGFVQLSPSILHDAPYDSCFRFSSMDNPELPNQYWRLVILIEHIVRHLTIALTSWPEQLSLAVGSNACLGSQYIPELDVVQAAHNICRSLEFCLDYKPIGSASMLYNLLIAFTVCEEDYKGWIAKVLVSEIMAALPSNYTIMDVASRYMTAMGMEGALENLSDCIALVEAIHED